MAGHKNYLRSGAKEVGMRGCQDAGRRLSVSPGTCARSYWLLDFTKPKTGRHGARGASWRNKCPFWMSSTQWGVVERVWVEGAVAGSRWAALAKRYGCVLRLEALLGGEPAEPAHVGTPFASPPAPVAPACPISPPAAKSLEPVKSAILAARKRLLYAVAGYDPRVIYRCID